MSKPKHTPIKYYSGIFNKFKNEPNLEHWENFPEIMWGLGFEMDCFKSFEELLKKSQFNLKKPKDERQEKRNNLYILEHSERQIVGNYLFSYWRYLTHWCYGWTEYDVDYLWRIITILEQAYQREFRQLKMIRIDSENICYGPMPMPDDEVFQRLSINSKGRVWLSRYAFGNGFSNYSLIKKEYLHFSEKATDELFDTISNCLLAGKLRGYDATDVGSWQATIIFDTGKSITLEGALINDNGCLHQISELIRNELKQKNIFVFDG